MDLGYASGWLVSIFTISYYIIILVYYIILYKFNLLTSIKKKIKKLRGEERQGKKNTVSFYYSESEAEQPTVQGDGAVPITSDSHP